MTSQPDLPALAKARKVVDAWQREIGVDPTQHRNLDGAPSGLERHIAAALAAQQELIETLLMERDAATDSTTQCLDEIERLAKALGAETERCAKKIESFMTPESGPNYGLMGDADRAAVRRSNRIYSGLANALRAQAEGGSDAE